MEKDILRLKEVKGSVRFFVCAIAVFVLDQITKLLVMKNIPWERGNPTYHFGGDSEPISVIDGFFYIVHITNEGAAWGIFSGQTFALTFIAAVALVATWLFRKHLGFGYSLAQIALGFFAGGVAGNLADRILYGHVVDFLDVHLPLINYRWPAFNIADCGICAGVILFMLLTFIEEMNERRHRKLPDDKLLTAKESDCVADRIESGDGDGKDS